MSEPDGGDETQFIRRAELHGWLKTWFLKWQPVIVRGSLYFMIGFLTPMVVEIKNVGTAVILHDWNWLDWITLFLESFLAGLTILRVYMDNSFARHSDKVKET